MIKKNVDFNESAKGVMVCEMGKGDIGSYVSPKVGSNGAIALFIGNLKEPKKIGATSSSITEIDNKMDYKLVITFSEIESLDLLIGSLNNCKAQLLIDMIDKDKQNGRI